MKAFRLLQQRTQQAARPGRSGLRLLHQSSQQPFRTRPSQSHPFRQYISSNSRPSPSSFTRAFRRRFHNTARRLEDAATPPTENLTLSQRLKKLSREYGWAAFGVYMALSALDLPFCYLTVKALGTDRIGHWEHVVMTWIKDTITWPVAGSPEVKEDVVAVTDKVETMVRAPLEDVRQGEKRILEEDDTYVVMEHGYKEAEKANEGPNASMSFFIMLNKCYYSADQSRFLDNYGLGLCTSQVVYFHPSPHYRRHHSQGCEDIERLGLEYWKNAEKGEFQRCRKLRQGWHQYQRHRCQTRRLKTKQTLALDKRYNLVSTMYKHSHSDPTYRGLSTLCGHRVSFPHIQQLQFLPILHFQTPLQRLKIPVSFLPHTDKLDLAFPLCTLNPKTDINDPMQLIQLPTDPRHF